MSKQEEIEQDFLGGLREAFGRRDWHKTSIIYETMLDIVERRQGVRVEATCLTARALVARKERSAARAMLQRIGDEEHPRAIH